MATQKPRCMITLDEELFNEVEDYRFEQRFQSRSEAVLHLIKLGLEAIEKETAEEEKQER